MKNQSTPTPYVLNIFTLPYSFWSVWYQKAKAKQWCVLCLIIQALLWTLTKENVNKRGYNKFLEISDNIKVMINQDKINEDEKWDGLKGYLTNTKLGAKEVYEQYRGLWVIECAYRVTKGTLEMRPMFHFTAKRIEAHVCICFVAYKVYKELERILKLNGINLSVDKVLNIAKTITTLKIKLPASGETLTKTMLLSAKHKSIKPLFDKNFWENFLG